MAVEGGMKCVKFLVFIFNFIFWVSAGRGGRRCAFTRRDPPPHPPSPFLPSGPPSPPMEIPDSGLGGGRAGRGRRSVLGLIGPSFWGDHAWGSGGGAERCARGGRCAGRRERLRGGERGRGSAQGGPHRVGAVRAVLSAACGARGGRGGSGCRVCAVPTHCCAERWAGGPPAAPLPGTSLPPTPCAALCAWGNPSAPPTPSSAVLSPIGPAAAMGGSHAPPPPPALPGPAPRAVIAAAALCPVGLSPRLGPGGDGALPAAAPGVGVGADGCVPPSPPPLSRGRPTFLLRSERAHAGPLSAGRALRRGGCGATIPLEAAR